MRSRFVLAVPIVALLAGAFISAAQTAPALVCEKLAGVRLPDTTITVAETVKGGSFTPPGSSNPIANLPAFCRVAGAIKPTKDSNILFEVWLPLEQWNGKLVGVGNGGWAGTISFGASEARSGAGTRPPPRIPATSQSAARTWPNSPSSIRSS